MRDEGVGGGSFEISPMGEVIIISITKPVRRRRIIRAGRRWPGGENHPLIMPLPLLLVIHGAGVVTSPVVGLGVVVVVLRLMPGVIILVVMTVVMVMAPVLAVAVTVT